MVVRFLCSFGSSAHSDQYLVGKQASRKRRQLISSQTSNSATMDREEKKTWKVCQMQCLGDFYICCEHTRCKFRCEHRSQHLLLKTGKDWRSSAPEWKRMSSKYMDVRIQTRSQSVRSIYAVLSDAAQIWYYNELFIPVPALVSSRRRSTIVSRRGQGV